MATTGDLKTEFTDCDRFPLLELPNELITPILVKLNVRDLIKLECFAQLRPRVDRVFQLRQAFDDTELNYQQLSTKLDQERVLTIYKTLIFRHGSELRKLVLNSRVTSQLLSEDGFARELAVKCPNIELFDFSDDEVTFAPFYDYAENVIGGCNLKQLTLRPYFNSVWLRYQRMVKMIGFDGQQRLFNACPKLERLMIVSSCELDWLAKSDRKLDNLVTVKLIVPDKLINSFMRLLAVTNLIALSPNLKKFEIINHCRENMNHCVALAKVIRSRSTVDVVIKEQSDKQL